MDRTRYDVDRIDTSTVTKQIDSYPQLASPFSKDLVEYYSNSANIFFENDDGELECSSFSGVDTLVFSVDLEEMLLKDIISMSLSCHIESDMRLTLSQAGIVDEISSYNIIDIVINKVGDIDVSIDLSSIDRERLIYLISAKKFKVFVDISSGLNVGSVIISDILLTCTFTNKLQDEIDAVKNRINYQETYSKEEIDEKIEDIVSGDIDLEQYMKKQDYTDDLGNQTDSSQFLRALDNVIINITGRGDDF